MSRRIGGLRHHAVRTSATRAAWAATGRSSSAAWLAAAVTKYPLASPDLPGQVVVDVEFLHGVESGHSQHSPHGASPGIHHQLGSPSYLS